MWRYVSRHVVQYLFNVITERGTKHFIICGCSALCRRYAEPSFFPVADWYYCVTTLGMSFTHTSAGQLSEVTVTYIHFFNGHISRKPGLRISDSLVLHCCLTCKSWCRSCLIVCCKTLRHAVLRHWQIMLLRNSHISCKPELSSYLCCCLASREGIVMLSICLCVVCVCPSRGCTPH